VRRDTINTDQTQATALTATPAATPATPNDVATAVVIPADDPLFDIDDFGDFNNFDDTVLDELDNDTGTRDPQFDVDDFGDFYNFELDELDGGTGIHSGISTVVQATSQFEDDTPLAPAQPDGTQSAREDGQRAQRTSRHARRGRNAPRPTSLRPDSLHVLFKGSKHDIHGFTASFDGLLGMWMCGGDGDVA